MKGPRLRIVLMSLALSLSLFSAAQAGDEYGGMKIESAKAEDGAIRVTSTGAEFIFNLPTCRIDLVQRIPQRRLLGTVTGLNLKGAELKLEEGQCRITVPATRTVFVIPAGRGKSFSGGRRAGGCPKGENAECRIGGVAGGAGEHHIL